MKITFVGVGNMAGAIIRSIINSGRLKPQDITLFDHNETKYEPFLKLGALAAKDLTEACEASNIILLAVKPQDYQSLLEDIKSRGCCDSSKIFISVAAAISTSYICSTLGIECPVVRVMPNTPLLLGVGATAISRNKYVTDKDYTKICGLFAASGTVTALDESLMNAVISVNSTSPVYLYMLAKAMIDNSVEQGIDEKASRELVFQALKGSVEMLCKSEYSPDELIKMVASPKGTTEAALKKLNELNFCDVVSKAMYACTQRADEIGR